MNALPFEYCGWNGQGITVWSRDFPKLFGLASVIMVNLTPFCRRHKKYQLLKWLTMQWMRVSQTIQQAVLL